MDLNTKLINERELTLDELFKLHDESKIEEFIIDQEKYSIKIKGINKPYQGYIKN